MIGGVALETIYWYTLLTCAGIAVFLLVFGDIFDFDGPIDPILIVPWLTFTSLFGYLGERLTELDSLFLLISSGAIATVLVFLLNFYVRMPMKNAESTLSASEKTLEGQMAIVVTCLLYSSVRLPPREQVGYHVGCVGDITKIQEHKISDTAI
ncbi:hypothetical protein K2D_27330 [Enterococcus hirae]|nr:hypothetical protein K2D_27330 [Enterococcus hirae]